MRQLLRRRTVEKRQQRRGVFQGPRRRRRSKSPPALSSWTTRASGRHPFCTKIPEGQQRTRNRSADPKLQGSTGHAGYPVQTNGISASLSWCRNILHGAELGPARIKVTRVMLLFQLDTWPSPEPWPKTCLLLARWKKAPSTRRRLAIDKRAPLRGSKSRPFRQHVARI